MLKKKAAYAIGCLLVLLSSATSSAQAEETIYHYGDGTSGATPPTPAQAAVGGFAIVNPETPAPIIKTSSMIILWFFQQSFLRISIIVVIK